VFVLAPPVSAKQEAEHDYYQTLNSDNRHLQALRQYACDGWSFLARQADKLTDTFVSLGNDNLLTREKDLKARESSIWKCFWVSGPYLIDGL